MRTPVTLLLTACGSRTVTYPLVECLSASQRCAYSFLGADTRPELIAPGLEVRLVPRDEPSFVASIRAWSEEVAIDCIVPLIEEDLLRLKADPWLAPRVLGPSLDKATLLADKGSLFAELQRSAPHLAPEFIAIDKLSELTAASRDLGYPRRSLILKPRRGRGGRGAIRLSCDPIREWSQGGLPQYTPEFLAAHVDPSSFAPSVVMPEAHGLDLSVYTFAAPGKPVIQVALEREASGAGITWSGAVHRGSAVLEYTASVVEAIRSESFVNFQLRWDGSRAVLYEANPRLSGSTSIAMLAGVNFPEIAVMYHLTGAFETPLPARALRFRRVIQNLIAVEDAPP